MFFTLWEKKGLPEQPLSRVNEQHQRYISLLIGTIWTTRWSTIDAPSTRGPIYYPDLLYLILLSSTPIGMT